MNSIFDSNLSKPLNCYSTEQNICEDDDKCNKLQQVEETRNNNHSRAIIIIQYQSHIVWCILILAIILSLIVVFWTWGDNLILNIILTIIFAITGSILIWFIVWSIIFISNQM